MDQIIETLNKLEISELLVYIIYFNLFIICIIIIINY